MQVCFLLVKEGLAHEEDAVVALHYRFVADLTFKNCVIKVQAKRTEFGAYCLATHIVSATRFTLTNLEPSQVSRSTFAEARWAS